MTLIRRSRSLILLASFATATIAQEPAETLSARVGRAAADHRHKLQFDGARFSGPAWEILLAEGAASQFFLLGEEHGIAENPKLAAALFRALVPSGYSKFVIEVSPPIASELDRAARGGLEGLRRHFTLPGGEPAFFGMKEEAELLASARGAVPGGAEVFWGVDYEVGGDRLLIARLNAMAMPDAARAALKVLESASAGSWQQYQTTRNPQFIYSFSGDPSLVRAVRNAWPDRGDKASLILDTLEETFEINRLWVAKEGWASNARRSGFMRRNFISSWRAEKKAGRTPRVFAKLGASHLTRGRNLSETWDLGALLPEIAALEGSNAFHLLVLPGAGARTAVFDPSEWTYKPAPAKDGYAKGLEPILGAAHPDNFTLIDLRPLRPIVASAREQANSNLARTVFGFDAILIMSGSTPSTNLAATK